MRRYILHQLLFVFGILLFSACSQDDGPQADEKASLQLNIKSSGSMLQARGVEDLNDDGTVSDLEKFVDGRKMYRLAVFLMDGNLVAGSTVLEADDERFENENMEASVSFENLDYSKTYTLYAVANYGNYGNNEEIKGHLSAVSADNMASGTVSASNRSNLCNRDTPYPLTLTQQITLTPGFNQVSGELVRTYSRIRINVRNQSSYTLSILKLEFAQKFTRGSTGLFAGGESADKRPVVNSDDAVTTFANNTQIPGANEITIFDGYLLESTGGDYNYTLGVKVFGQNGTELTQTEKNIPIEIIDRNTGAVSPLKAIRRNDFIDILVNVNYNDKSGEINFEVAGWNRVEGTVDFN